MSSKTQSEGQKMSFFFFVSPCSKNFNGFTHQSFTVQSYLPRCSRPMLSQIPASRHMWQLTHWSSACMPKETHLFHLVLFKLTSMHSGQHSGLHQQNINSHAPLTFLSHTRGTQSAVLICFHNIKTERQLSRTPEHVCCHTLTPGA